MRSYELSKTSRRLLWATFLTSFGFFVYPWWNVTMLLLGLFGLFAWKVNVDNSEEEDF